MNNGHFFEYQKWLLYTGFTVVIKENDDEVKFHEIKIAVFHEIKIAIFHEIK